MRKPKNFKDFVLGLLFVGILCAIAWGIGWLLQTDPEPGDIKVYSGDIEITTLQNVIGEETKKESIDHDRFDLAEDAADFPVVVMEKSIMLEATQDPISDMYYTLYDADFTELYYRAVSFSYPEEPGTYYVVIDTMWGRSDHNFTTQHGFTLAIEE